MKNKLISFFVLIIFLAPLVSQAWVVVPSANLTITVNTEGEDRSFHFKLDYDEFDLTTENLTVTETIFVLAFGDTRALTQDEVQGFKTDIQCTSDNPNDPIIYFSDGNGVFFTPEQYENISCIFNNTKVPEKNPVLIVPGLLGTEMKKGEELLWANVPRLATSVTDSFMNPLMFNEDLTPSDVDISVSDVIREKTVSLVKLFDYTDGIIKEFQKQGYIEDESLFLFPYDWRYGVSGKYADGKTNVDLLEQKISDILQQTGSDKIDVIAHSNGGLLVKKYVMDNPTNHGIDKAVFIGVPNTGAPRTIKALVQGDNMDISFSILGLSEAEMKKLAENMPASYDLLPSPTYYSTKGSFVKIVDLKNPFDFFDSTEKDLNYHEFKDYLIDKGLNSTAMENSENLHTFDFDNYDLRNNGIDLYNIVGCKSATMTGFAEVKSQDFFGDYHTSYDSVKLKVGDGTVPIESATNLPVSQENKFYVLKTRHSNLLSEDGSRQKIVNLIAESNLTVSSQAITQDVSKCQLNGKGFSVFSPIDIFVTDQFGNKLGLAEDGSIINEIPGADFEVWASSAEASAEAEQHKFVFVPTDGGQVYTTSLTGTGSGNYTIKIDDIQNSEITKTEVFSNLAITPELTGNVVLAESGDQPDTLVVRPAAGAEPETILPSATLAGPQIDDLFPPISIPTLNGAEGQPGFYRSDVIINIKATDENSGVLNINYNLNNQGWQKVAGDPSTGSGQVNLTASAEGSCSLTFFSTDQAGNNEQEQTITFTIDKTPPEAIIEFDPAAKDLKFTSQDPNVSIQDQDNKITLTDQAGNTTEIQLKDKNRKRIMKAEIESIKYNGVAADLRKNQMLFSWLYDKNKNLKMLSQFVKSKNDYNILAVYNGKNTTFIGKDSTGKIKKIEKGLKIIKIATNKGGLNWSY